MNIGVVRHGVTAIAEENQAHDCNSSNNGWIIGCDSGQLFGIINPGEDATGVGYIPGGHILTVKYDSAAGTLQFFRDGLVLGPGYAEGVHAEEGLR